LREAGVASEPKQAIPVSRIQTAVIALVFFTVKAYGNPSWPGKPWGKPTPEQCLDGANTEMTDSGVGIALP
jgi:hypothetical protein